MFRRSGLLLLLAAFTASASLAAIFEQRVSGIEVQGSREIRKAAMVLGLEKGLGQPLTDRLVMRGVEQLKRIGRAAGVKVDFRFTPRGAWICYRVRENPKIESIEFRGNRLIQSEELLRELEVRPGDILDYDVLYREVNRIPAIYLERKGVLYSGVLSPAAVDVKGGKIVIDIQEFKLMHLEIRGVRGRLKDAVLASLPLPRGRVLRRADLLGGLFNVYQLPEIRNVDYNPRFDRQKGEITLVLNLTRADQPAASPSSRGKLD